VRLGSPLVLAALAFWSVSCASKHNDPAPPPEDPNATPPAATSAVQPWAANAGDIARFADEEPFGPSATVAQDKTRVRTAPGAGDVVATLAAGTDVVKLATHGTDDLVCFDEPKPGTRHLMGWVPQSALTDPPPSPPAPPSPPPSWAGDGGTTPPSPDPPAPHGHHHRHKKSRQ
jgi:hypothetical protein